MFSHHCVHKICFSVFGLNSPKFEWMPRQECPNEEEVATNPTVAPN